MGVSWNNVKRKLKLRRRQIVDVHLPEYDEAAVEARIDRESDQQRRDRLRAAGRGAVIEGWDRHNVRKLYREVFGHP